MNHKNFTARTDWLLTAMPLQRKFMLQPKTDLRNLRKTPNIINFQRVVGGSAIDDNVLNVFIGLAVYRCQTTGHVGGAVVCGGYD
jgi:hypothetical protein